MGTDAVISLAGVAVSLVGAWLIAKKYGDVAGTLAARRFQEEDAKRARATAFQSLINGVVRIREVAKHYQSPGFGVGRGVPKFPVTAFETAFVSGSPGLATSSELLDAVNDYLIVADSINSFVDICLARGGDWSGPIKQACTPLPEILDQLSDCLQRLHAVALDGAELRLRRLGRSVKEFIRQWRHNCFCKVQDIGYGGDRSW